MRIQDLEVEHHATMVRGIRMHYAAKGSGPLVVLLHGFPENWWSWRYQIDALAEQGFRVIAPDLRGYNETEKKGPFDIRTLTDDVVALIHSLGESAMVVGHDWGGALAFNVAAQYPRVVKRLVVINCPHPTMMFRALLSNWSQIKRSWYMFFFLIPYLPEHLLTRHGGRAVKGILRKSTLDRRNFSDEELQPYVDAIVKPDAAHAMVSWYRAAIIHSLLRPKGVKNPPIIQAPTLLLWGLDDAALGYEALVPGTEQLCKDFTVETFEHCGHFAQMEQPSRINPSLIAFLKKL